MSPFCCARMVQRHDGYPHGRTVEQTIRRPPRDAPLGAVGVDRGEVSGDPGADRTVPGTS